MKMWFSFLFFFYFLEMKVICRFVLYLNCIWCYTGGTSVYYRRSIVVLLFLKHIFVHGWFPPLVLHISIDLAFPETDHVNPTRICLEFAGFLFRHSTQLCCNWGDASKSMCRYTALFMKYAGHYSQEYHEWKGSFVDWLRSFFYRDRLWLRLCFMWEWNVGKLHLSSLGLE